MRTSMLLIAGLLIAGLLIIGAAYLVMDERRAAPVGAGPENEAPGQEKTVDDPGPLLETREGATARPRAAPTAVPPTDAAEAGATQDRNRKIERVLTELRSNDPKRIERTWQNPKVYDAEDTRALVSALAAEWKQGVSPSWTFSAQELLRQIGEDAIVPLAEALGNEHAFFWAATALTRVADLRGDISSAVPTLIEHLRAGTPTAQMWAAQVLKSTGPRRLEAVRDLTTLLESDTQQVRVEAARALGEMGPAAAIALDAIERRLEVLGPGGGTEGDAFRESHERIQGR